MESERPFYLLPNERVLRHERMVKAWGVENIVSSVIIGLIIWGGITVAAFVAQLQGAASIATIAGVLFTVQLLITLLYVWRRLATTEYYVTEEAVYTRRGQLILSIGSALLDRVTDLHVHRSLLGRVFGYAGLSVRTAGGGLLMTGLREAYEIRSSIQEARSQLITKLLRESGRTPGSAGPTEPESATADVQCPTCNHVFPAARTRPLDVTCPNCQESGALLEEAPA